MALGSAQPLTEMSTKNIPGGKQRPEHYGRHSHRHLCADCLENVRASQPYKFPRPVTGIALLYNCINHDYVLFVGVGIKRGPRLISW
jgi:hypothetical protein